MACLEEWLGEILFFLNPLLFGLQSCIRANYKPSGKTVLWIKKTKVEMFIYDAKHIWRKPNTGDRHKCLIPTVSTVVEGS